MRKLIAKFALDDFNDQITIYQLHEDCYEVRSTLWNLFLCIKTDLNSAINRASYYSINGYYNSDDFEGNRKYYPISRDLKCQN